MELLIGDSSWELDIVLLSWLGLSDGPSLKKKVIVWGEMYDSLDEPASRSLWKSSTKGLERNETYLDEIESKFNSEANLICS